MKTSISLLGLSNPYQQQQPASSLSKGLMPKVDQVVHTSDGTVAMITDGTASKELLKPSATASSISSIQKVDSNDSRVIGASMKLEVGNTITIPPVGTTTGQQKRAVPSKPTKGNIGSHVISPKKATPQVSATASVMKRISTVSDNVTLTLSSIRPMVVSAPIAALAIGKELGHAKYKAILSSSDVSIYLSGVTVDNVHSAAKKMRTISPDDMVKGLLGVIAIHLRGDLLDDWRRLPLIASSLVPPGGMQEGASSSSAAAAGALAVQLMPLTMIERLDALVSLLISLTTRTGWGLDALDRLIDGLSNHILCSIRNQLSSSPFYAAVMGTCSSGEDKSIGRGDRYDDSRHDVAVPGDVSDAPTDDAMVQESSSSGEEDDDDSVRSHQSYSSVDDDSVATGEEETSIIHSDDDDGDDVTAAPEHELASDIPSVRRSELAALLDLGSSDDSEDDAFESPTTTAACPHRDITPRLLLLSDGNSSSGHVIDTNLSSSDNTTAVAPPSSCALSQSSSPQLDQQWIKAFSTTSTLYILLSLLLRLVRSMQSPS